MRTFWHEEHEGRELLPWEVEEIERIKRRQAAFLDYQPAWKRKERWKGQKQARELRENFRPETCERCCQLPWEILIVPEILHDLGIAHARRLYLDKKQHLLRERHVLALLP